MATLPTSKNDLQGNDGDSTKGQSFTGTVVGVSASPNKTQVLIKPGGWYTFDAANEHGLEVAQTSMVNGYSIWAELNSTGRLETLAVYS